jgi:ABC-type phosphate/phosphonate transport system substrate-binding protein
LAQTGKLPGFLWVGSPRLSEESIRKIKTAMLALKPLKNPDDAAITRSWNPHIRYGAIEASDRDYDGIREMLRTVTIPEL